MSVRSPRSWQRATEAISSGRAPGSNAARRDSCATHTTRLVETDRRRSGGTLGSGILLAAVLRQRLDELAGVAAAGRGRGSNRRLAAAAQPPDCQICEHARTAEGLAATSLVGLAGLPEWNAALSTSSICLDHLVGSGAVAARSAREVQDRWQIVATAQLDRLAAVSETLEGFIANSSFERRSSMTAEQLEATDAAAEALAPTARIGRTDRTGRAAR